MEFAFMKLKASDIPQRTLSLLTLWLRRVALGSQLKILKTVRIWGVRAGVFLGFTGSATRTSKTATTCQDIDLSD
jgi:hypothetical protein